ncbi:caspase family protein, partial [Saccharothrix sp. NPDC042600]
MSRRLALLIATYEYEDAGLRRLTTPAHDAETFAEVLADPSIAGFEVTTLVNEPLHRVGRAIGEFYRDRRRDDLTLLYFTGHGLKDDEGRLYLAMTNTVRDNLLFTGLAAEHVDQAMEGCASRRKILVLDCCYSGAFPAGRLAKADPSVHALERFQGRGRTVLTASDATQYSFEGGGDQPRGRAAQSVFTRYLVAGLRDGSADLDGDGDITVDELYSYVHDRVVEEMPQQRPKKQDDVQGRTVIARNVNWTLPAYLANALASPIATDRLNALAGLARLRRVGNEVVRSRAEDEIRRLADDDSRQVSAAANALLTTPQPPTPEPPTPEPPTAPKPPPAPPTTPATRVAPAPPTTPATRVAPAPPAPP